MANKFYHVPCQIMVKVGRLQAGARTVGIVPMNRSGGRHTGTWGGRATNSTCAAAQLAEVLRALAVVTENISDL